SAVTPQTEVLIKPEAPIFISGTEATVDFKVYSIAGEMTNPQIKYIKWIKNVKFQADAFAKGGDEIPASDIISITPQPIRMGSNSLSFTVPARDTSEHYAFFELIIEGTSADGQKVASSVGFLPFRVIDYKFEVEIYDATGATKLTEVTAGVPVQLKVTPLKKDGSPIMANIKPIAVSLSSKYNVYSAPNDTVFFPNGVTGPSTSSIIFTKVPDVGTDRVTVNGKYGDEAISGISEAIKINPGDPAKVKFQSPPSGATGKVNPGLSAPVAVQVYDAYDNKVNKPAQATLTSANPAKISVVNPTETTNESGLATFQVSVGPEGNPNDSASINVALVAKPDAQDNAWMKVGRARDRFVIFYSDTLGFDANVGISTCAGQRVPVTIRALVFVAETGKDSLVTSRTNKFDIILTPGLEAYSSLSELDATPITQADLVSGQAVIWVKANQAVDNGMLTISASGDNSITKGERENISFLLCKTSIARASYHADNGQGQVDRLEVFFKDTIKATDIPDSIQLFWPNTDAANGKWVYKRTHYPETPDPADPMHFTVSVQPPFAAAVTFSSVLQLGTAYVRDADGVSRPNPFPIADSVGPLLMTAELVERLPENATGVDTIYVSLSESVASSLIQGGTLTLIKHAGATEVPLTIQ
ncbi:MAG: hypothetical protein GX556_08635, partial [Fibrobacter sp.]|nr:hypothetical protein [Fibrobacter sp.]